MDNFKGFELTNEQAMMVTGARKGRGKRGKRGKKGELFQSLTEEQREGLKAELTALRATEGWEDLSKEDRKAAKKEIFAQYLPADEG